MRTKCFNVHTGEHLDESTGSQILAAIQEVATSTSDHVSVPTVDTHDVAQHTQKLISLLICLII